MSGGSESFAVDDEGVGAILAASTFAAEQAEKSATAQMAARQM
jgi:hypothetical protein